MHICVSGRNGRNNTKMYSVGASRLEWLWSRMGHQNVHMYWYSNLVHVFPFCF